METRTERSLIDLSLHARYLRSAHLARLFLKALTRLRGIRARDTAGRGHAEVALQRR